MREPPVPRRYHLSSLMMRVSASTRLRVDYFGGDADTSRQANILDTLFSVYYGVVQAPLDGDDDDGRLSFLSNPPQRMPRASMSGADARRAASFAMMPRHAPTGRCRAPDRGRGRDVPRADEVGLRPTGRLRFIEACSARRVFKICRSPWRSMG